MFSTFEFCTRCSMDDGAYAFANARVWFTSTRRISRGYAQGIKTGTVLLVQEAKSRKQQLAIELEEL